MIHPLLLLLGTYLIIVGIVICVLLVVVSFKGAKGIWLVTIPGILIVAFLGINFACHMLHLPPVLPHQKQIATIIHQVMDVLVVPLIALKLYEWWQKRMRARTALALPQKPENL